MGTTLPDTLPPYVKTLGKGILLILTSGALLTTAIVAPNALQLLKPFLRKGKRSNYAKERIRKTMNSLVQRGLISHTVRHGGTAVLLTKEGRRYLTRLSLDDFQLPKGVWDQKWRLILFDIPEDRKKARTAFRQHLKSLGCFHLQKSVFAYPYHCRDEIHFLTSFWDVQRYVQYIEASTLGTAEKRALRFFTL